MLYREISGLHEAAFLLATFALFSKVLALVRDRILAHTFGAGIELDIYYAAFRIPDFIYISLASIVASAVLIPFVVEKMDNNEDLKKFFNGIFTLFFAGMVVVSIIAAIAMPYLSSLIAPGFDASAQKELILLSRIMLFSPFLLGISGLFASITQSLRRFFVYALGPIFYNVGIIIGITLLYPIFGFAGLAYGVILGALLHALIQVPVLMKNDLFPRFSFDIDWGDIKNILILSMPRTLTLSAHHLALLVLIAMASLMIEGSISVFNLSFNLQSVPLSIIGVSYSIAAFPTLARLFSSGKEEAFVSQIVATTRHIIFWSIPVIILFIVLRAQIVRTILGSGEFGWAETKLTAAVLAIFAVSVIAQSLILLFVRGYYAAGQTIRPLIINTLSSLSIIAFAYYFVWVYENHEFFRFFVEALLRVEDVAGTKILMLPLAFSLGIVINVFVLWHYFKKDFNIPTLEISTTFRQSFLASVLMGFVSYNMLQVFDNIFDINTFIGILSQGVLSALSGIIVGILILKLMDSHEGEEILRSVRRKFWRREREVAKSLIAPDQEEL